MNKKEYHRQYYLAHKEEMRLYNAKRYHDNPSLFCERAKKYYINNIEHIKIYRKEAWKNRNQEEYNKKRRESHKKNPLPQNLRRRLRHALSSNYYKNGIKEVGCTIDFLKKYLQNKFKEGMSWGNYGRVWHIDHIVPFAKAKTIEEKIKLAHYTNLQPLFALENFKKGGR